MYLSSGGGTTTLTVIRGVNNIAQALIDDDPVIEITEANLGSIRELYSGRFDFTGFFRVNNNPGEDDNGHINKNLDITFVGSETNGQLNAKSELIIEAI